MKERSAVLASRQLYILETLFKKDYSKHGAEH